MTSSAARLHDIRISIPNMTPDDSGAVRAEVRLDGAVIARADVYADGDVDLVEAPDDEQLIRHFGVEAARASDDPRFDEQREQLESTLAQHVSQLVAARLSRPSVSPLGGLRSTPAHPAPSDGQDINR